MAKKRRGRRKGRSRAKARKNPARKNRRSKSRRGGRKSGRRKNGQFKKRNPSRGSSRRKHHRRKRRNPIGERAKSAGGKLLKAAAFVLGAVGVDAGMNAFAPLSYRTGAVGATLRAVGGKVASIAMAFAGRKVKFLSFLTSLAEPFKLGAYTIAGYHYIGEEILLPMLPVNGLTRDQAIATATAASIQANAAANGLAGPNYRTIRRPASPQLAGPNFTHIKRTAPMLGLSGIGKQPSPWGASHLAR